MSTLSASKSVLQHQGEGRNGHVESVIVGLTPERFHDMGKPDEITVTIERGDTLNG